MMMSTATWAAMTSAGKRLTSSTTSPPSIHQTLTLRSWESMNASARRNLLAKNPLGFYLDHFIKDCRRELLLYKSADESHCFGWRAPDASAPNKRKDCVAFRTSVKCRPHRVFRQFNAVPARPA